MTTDEILEKLKAYKGDFQERGDLAFSPRNPIRHKTRKDKWGSPACPLCVLVADLNPALQDKLANEDFETFCQTFGSGHAIREIAGAADDCKAIEPGLRRRLEEALL